MSFAGRKLPIRMIDSDGAEKSEVVGIHVDPGGSVRENYPVMTVMTGPEEHRIRAPRPGFVMPMVSVGDEVGGGDVLFVLCLDETALSSDKSHSKPSPLRPGTTTEPAADESAPPVPLRRAKSEPAVPLRRAKTEPTVPLRRAKTEPTVPLRRAKTEPPVPLRPGRIEPAAHPDEEPVDGSAWLKPVLALAVYLIASFLLFPILLQMGGSASIAEVSAVAGMAIVIVVLVLAFLMPSQGSWPRRLVRMLSLGWLMVLAYPLYPQFMNAPTPAAIALEEHGTAGDREPVTPSPDR